MNRRGLTLIEVAALLVTTAVLVAAGMPALQHQRCNSQEARSVSNLMTLAAAHASYAADWNDRQFTVIRDDIGAFGSCVAYTAANDGHPPLILGENCNGVTIGAFFPADGSGCDSFLFVRPFDFNTGFGSFRIPNARGFHEYVNGRYHDPTFSAPRDTVVTEFIGPLWGVDCEYAAPGTGNEFVLSSSYVLSPAAMFDPGVFTPPGEENPNGTSGWTAPDTYAEGYRSPTVSQALYPSQKSRMLEHHWLQRRVVSPCNPSFAPGTWDGCEPWYFNAGSRSNPITLFYDGHVRGLSMLETQQSDRTFTQQEGFGLWQRDTALGGSGYFGQEAFDFLADNNSYHILTTDGIRGRDTLR